MRNVLSDLEQAGDVNTIDAIVSNLFRLRGPVDRDNLDEMKAKNLLSEFRAIVGNDPIEAEMLRREKEKARLAYQESISERQLKTQQLKELNDEFISLASSGELTPQQRGFRLEALFFDLLHYSELDCTKPFRTPDGEQIDGHFKYEKFDYLVEVKWTRVATKQKDLSIFDGKIRGKAQSTRGFFLSANGFDDNAISKFSGDAPRIILTTGEDLALILSNQISFFDAMKAKVDAIVRYGNIKLALRSITS